MRLAASARRALLLLCALGSLLAPADAQARRHPRRARPAAGRPEDDAHLKGDAKAFAHATVHLAAPADRGELPVGEAVRVEIAVAGYALGPAPGAAEGAPGPHAHLVVDNDVALTLVDARPVLLRGLAPGPHLLRVVLCRPWHEVVKAEGAFALARFWVGPRLAGKAGLAAEYAVWPDPKKPILTYVLPLSDAPPGAATLVAAEAAAPDAGVPAAPREASADAGDLPAADGGRAAGAEPDAGAALAEPDAGSEATAAQVAAAPAPPAAPLTLDVYLSGARLVHRGHKVRIVIDKKEYPTLRAWKPLRLDHLKAGQHRISIDLLDRRGTKVRNALNRSDRTFGVPAP